MRIARFLQKTAAEGPGCRACVWVQGCAHRCDGCFAQSLWDPDGGSEIDVREIIRSLDKNRDALRGITLLGGEPFDQAKELSIIAAYAHEIGLDVIAFTGYLIEELQSRPDAMKFLDHVDLLLDGEYKKELRDFSRPLVGSSNQRFLYLSARITPEEMAAYKNRFEIRTDSSGAIRINGMGNLETIDQYIKNDRGEMYGSYKI